MNGGEGYEGMDEGEHSSIFKQKYERAAKELEYTKQRLQQQHEDDLEQLVALKKQLEKKVIHLLPHYCILKPRLLI